MTIQIGQSVVEGYQRDGAVVIRNALTADEIALLTQGIEENIAAPGPLAAVASAADDPGRFFEDFCCWQRIPGYEAIMRDSAPPASTTITCWSRRRVRGSRRRGIRISPTTTSAAHRT
jgi:hypothetical protein